MYFFTTYNEEMTFSDISNAWLIFHRSRVKYNSFEMYVFKVNAINEYFGDYKIEDIDAIMVQKYLNTLADNGLSKSTIKKYKVTLHQIFNFCIFNKIMTTNPCDFVELPRTVARPPRRTLTKNEIEVITRSVNIENGLYPFMLLYTGLRRSECLALKWEDFDFDQNLIHIYKACIYNKNIPHIDYQLKNGDSERFVPLPTILKKVLQSNRYKNQTGWVFNCEGQLLTKNQIDNCFAEYLKQTGINFTQHMARHAYATMLYNAGVDVKVAQRILGHKCITMTMAIYTHLDAKNIDSSAEKINQYLSTGF